MYDILQFIDSPDIRAYSKEQTFTPAQECVLIAFSEKRTIEEKIKALQYILNYYGKEELRAETVSKNGPLEDADTEQFFEAVQRALRIWQEILMERYCDSDKAYMQNV